MTTALIVPVLNNFTGLAKLFESVDTAVLPIVVNNWDDNRGVSKGWNIGLKKAMDYGCEYAIVVNDDAIFRPGVMNTMTARLHGKTILSFPYNETGQGHPRGLNFWCFAVRPVQLVEEVGWFDENFSPAYFEDDDMAYRIRLAGYRMDNIGMAAYHQVWGSSQGKHVDWSRQEDYYIRKWGGKPGEEKFTTPFRDRTKTIKDWQCQVA